jgi:hypothetical protein
MSDDTPIILPRDIFMNLMINQLMIDYPELRDIEIVSIVNKSWHEYKIIKNIQDEKDLHSYQIFVREESAKLVKKYPDSTPLKIVIAANELWRKQQDKSE